MSMRYTRGVVAVAVLAGAMTAGTERATYAQGKMAVTAVGCLQGERQYRRDHESSKFAGTGAGLNDEYVLIDAVVGGPSMAVAPMSEKDADCTTARGGGQAFELTGPAESGLSSFLGRRVVIHGLLKHAKHDAIGTSGTATLAPNTKGVDILNHDLDIREINVETVSLVPIAAAAKNEPAIFAAPEPAAEPAAEPAPAPAPEPAAEQPVPETPAPAPAELPKTASPLPAIGLLGLLSLVAGAGLRLRSRAS